MYTTEYYSVLKEKDTLLYVATWMKLEDIMLSKMRQKEKDKNYLIPLILQI